MQQYPPSAVITYTDVALSGICVFLVGVGALAVTLYLDYTIFRRSRSSWAHHHIQTPRQLVNTAIFGLVVVLIFTAATCFFRYKQKRDSEAYFARLVEEAADALRRVGTMKPDSNPAPADAPNPSGRDFAGTETNRR